jgi:hypothetical protein
MSSPLLAEFPEKVVANTSTVEPPPLTYLRERK